MFLDLDLDNEMWAEPAKPDVPASDGLKAAMEEQPIVPASDRLKAAIEEQPIEQWSDSKLVSMALEFLHEECGEEIYVELGKRGIYDWIPVSWEPPPDDDLWHW